VARLCLPPQLTNYFGKSVMNVRAQTCPIRNEIVPDPPVDGFTTSLPQSTGYSPRDAIDNLVATAKICLFQSFDCRPEVDQLALGGAGEQAVRSCHLQALAARDGYAVFISMSRRSARN
jgi:hypothetical protein